MAALSILPPGGFLFATTYALKQGLAASGLWAGEVGGDADPARQEARATPVLGCALDVAWALALSGAAADGGGRKPIGPRVVSAAAAGG